MLDERVKVLLPQRSGRFTVRGADGEDTREDGAKTFAREPVAFDFTPCQS